MTLPQLQGLAVGDPGVVQLQAHGEVMRMTALGSGTTHVLAWSRNGERRLYTVSVTPR